MERLAPLRPRPLHFLLLVSVQIFFLPSLASASVHVYAGVQFAAKSNAFVLHGGSEGLYASIPNPNASAAAGNGDSFIRYAYSDDVSEDFDREDTLSLIKPLIYLKFIPWWSNMILASDILEI